MSNSNVVNNMLSVTGNISNSQIQQNTSNSSQYMSKSLNFEYDKALRVLLLLGFVL